MRIRALCAVLLLTLLAGCGTTPTTPLPASLCQAIGPALIAELVPGTVPVAATQNHGRWDLGESCESHSDFDHNDLRVTVERYPHCEHIDDGDVCDLNAASDNKSSFDTQCAARKHDAATLGAFSQPAGLGEAACQSLKNHLSTDEVSAELLVRNTTDQISVNYTGFGTRLTPPAAAGGARQVAVALLNALTKAIDVHLCRSAGGTHR